MRQTHAFGLCCTHPVLALDVHFTRTSIQEEEAILPFFLPLSKSPCIQASSTLHDPGCAETKGMSGGGGREKERRDKSEVVTDTFKKGE